MLTDVFYSSMFTRLLVSAERVEWDVTIGVFVSMKNSIFGHKYK